MVSGKNKKTTMYHGFAARDYLILDNIPLGKEMSVLEIGIGTGSTAELVISKVKEFWGVDISVEATEILNRIYGNKDNVKIYCRDICSEGFLGKCFDVIYSADTLEHVKQPGELFNFIKRHLSHDGSAVIAFPNESEVKHHGITWFNNKEEIITLLDCAGLKYINFFEIKPTFSHRIIKKVLCELPKLILSRKINTDNIPQTIERTEAFQIIKDGGIKAYLFSHYARSITGIAALLPLYNYFEVGDEIKNKNLLIYLQHK